MEHPELSGLLTIKASEIRKGDKFGNERNGWIAVEDAQVQVPEDYLVSRADRGVELAVTKVQHFPDGGIGPRGWLPDQTIEIYREPQEG